jgi:hypothetical protein
LSIGVGLSEFEAEIASFQSVVLLRDQFIDNFAFHVDKHSSGHKWKVFILLARFGEESTFAFLDIQFILSRLTLQWLLLPEAIRLIENDPRILTVVDQCLEEFLTNLIATLTDLNCNY